MDQYISALSLEAEQYKGKRIHSIYIGGGTPSTLDVLQLNKLFEFISRNFSKAIECEVTIEANPEGLTQEKLAFLRDMGINRISLGIQSLNDKYLKYLGRIHSRAKALESYELIRKVGFENVNCDLMFSFPEQTDQDITAEVNDLSQLQCEHVSLYALTVEPNSRFYAKKVELPDGQRQADQYSLIRDLIHKNNYRQYEVSNFSKPGFESSHNINYWQAGEYIGLGVGAHSYLEGARSENVSKFVSYISLLEAGESAQDSSRTLSLEQQLVESLLFGLRMIDGVDIRKLEAQYRCPLDVDRRVIIDSFLAAGLLIREKDILRTTEKGLMVLDELCARLI